MEEKKHKNGFKDYDIDNLEIEDATKYGEFISSYFGWISMEKQKKRARELEDITREDNE